MVTVSKSGRDKVGIEQGCVDIDKVISYFFYFFKIKKNKKERETGLWKSQEG